MAATIQRGANRRRPAGAALALLAAFALAGPAAARRHHHPTQTADDLPLPPDPPDVVPAAPAAPASPASACSKEDAGAKAERLLGLLQELIARDPDRARLLLDAFQQAVQRFTQQGEDLAEECRSFDTLIARAAGRG